MKEIAIRAASGAVYAALIIGGAIYGTWTTALVFGVATAIGAAEWHRLYFAHLEKAPPVLLTVVLALATFGLSSAVVLAHDLSTAQVATIIASLLIVACFIALRSSAPDPGRSVAGHVATVALFALPMSCAVHLVHRDPVLLIGFMILLWTNDTGAYLFGRAMGRNKLMPAVSPGKTWEGFAGGLLVNLGMAWWLAHAWPAVLPAELWLGMAALITATATIGDLFESALKRSAGVKDSGHIMPGHGGLLDRFDGYLFAAPMVLLALWALMG